MVSTSIRPTARATYQLVRGLLLFIVLACFSICIAIFAAPLQTTPQVMETWEFRGTIRNPIWPIISAILAVLPNIIELFCAMKDKEPEKLRTGWTLVVLIIVDILCFLLLLGASSMTIAFAGMDVPLVGALSLAMVVASLLHLVGMSFACREVHLRRPRKRVRAVRVSRGRAANGTSGMSEIL